MLLCGLFVTQLGNQGLLERVVRAEVIKPSSCTPRGFTPVSRKKLEGIILSHEIH